jgi:uncharacterized protein
VQPVVLWLAQVLLAIGAVASLLVSRIWVVPMALVSRDPRMVGAALVCLGLVVAGVGLLLRSRQELRRAQVMTASALAALSVAAAAWAIAASPYDLEEVAFENAPASLVGTLVLPRGAGPHPAVVFMHGSGAERRGVSFYFADRYVRAGFAALIYDKRGSGGSRGGNPRDAYADLAGDALAGVRLLREHPDIDPRRVGLWGLSEGGWTAPLAASQAPDEVAFLVIVSGGGASTQDENHYSIRTHLEDRGIGAEGIAQALALRARIDGYYRTGQDREAIVAEIRRVEGTDWFAAADWYLPRPSEVYLHGSDEWRAHMTFLDFDALPLLRDLDLPMLFVHGELDRSYPAALSADRLAELTMDSTRDVSVITYEGADHSILTRRAPWPRYADGYVEHMVTWAQDRLGTNRR